MAVTKIDLGTQAQGTLPAAQLPALSGDVSSSAGSASVSVTKINGTALSGLATGILKNTTTTGVPSIAVAGTDYLTPSGSSAALSQATTGAFGVVKPDGSTITISAGVISAASAPNFAEGEVPSGTIGSANATFTLAHTPVASSLKLYLNGVRQIPGAGNDYTLSTGTITMLNVPVTGDTLVADYRY